MQHNGGLIAVAVLLCLLANSDCGVVSGGGGDVDRAGHSVLRVQAHEIEQVDKVLELAKRHDAKEWVEVNRARRYVDVMVHPDKKEPLIRALREAHIDMNVMIEDVQEIIKRHILLQKRSSNSNFNYLQFNPFYKIEAELKRIAEQRSDVAKLVVLGQTYEKNNMYMLRVTNDIKDNLEKPTKPIVLIDAGIHSREWVSVSTIMYIINELVENPRSDSYIKAFLDSYDFVFMPVLNPDGYKYTWEHDRLWRKNRAPNANSTCIGVDLNRNWDYKWGGEGTSGDPCQIDFRGYSAFSELETKAAKQWVEMHRNKIVLYINFHAYGQLWMTPYGYSEDKPSNEKEMLDYSKIAVEAIQNVRGTTYTTGPVYTTIYPASSISVDWVRGAEEILIAYTVELPDKGLNGFITPVDEIGPVGKETWKGIEQLLLKLAEDKKLLRTTEIIIV